MTRPPGLHVWGCRGSVPVADPAMRIHGGETSCYQVTGPGPGHLIIDCGTGLRRFGASLTGADPGPVDILLSHPHFDHLLGLGFFLPALAGRSEVTIWSPLAPDMLRAALDRLFGPPLWPVEICRGAALNVRRIEGRTRVGTADVTAFALNHPGGSTGYRIETGGKVICSVTDHEHGIATIDDGIRHMVAGADLMLYDAAYPDRLYPAHRGWGHSSWDVGLALAAETGVGHTLLVHHAPDSTDALLEAGRRQLGNPVSWEFARDGMDLVL